MSSEEHWSAHTEAPLSLSGLYHISWALFPLSQSTSESCNESAKSTFTVFCPKTIFARATSFHVGIFLPQRSVQPSPALCMFISSLWLAATKKLIKSQHNFESQTKTNATEKSFEGSGKGDLSSVESCARAVLLFHHRRRRHHCVRFWPPVYFSECVATFFFPGAENVPIPRHDSPGISSATDVGDQDRRRLLSRFWIYTVSR